MENITKRNRQNRLDSSSTGSSDNGGFGITNAPLKKGRLRYSFDKISLKTSLPWNSSDKLALRLDKTKPKSRRYSDSSLAVLTVNGLDAKKKCPNDSNSSDKTPLTKKILGVSRWLKLKSNTNNKNNAFKVNDRKATSFENSDCVIEPSAKLVRPGATKTEATAASTSTRLRMLHEAKRNNIINETLPRIDQLPQKSSFPVLPVDKNALKLRTLSIEHYTAVESSKTSKQSFSRFDVKPNPKASTFTEPVETILKEPPLLPPVSGQLLASEKMDRVILRPTACRFNPTRATESIKRPSYSCRKSWHSTTGVTNESQQQDSALPSRPRLSSESNNSDSGRHSISSLHSVVPAADSYCSVSEGYGSARVSSTAQAVLQESLNSDDSQLLKIPRDFEENKNDLTFRDHVDKLGDMTFTNTSGFQSQNKSTKRTQDYQFNVLYEENERLREVNEKLLLRISSMADELEATEISRTRLEENEIELQQKLGEISLLKRQVKEKDSEARTRFNEILALRSKNHELSSRLDQSEATSSQLAKKLAASACTSLPPNKINFPPSYPKTRNRSNNSYIHSHLLHPVLDESETETDPSCEQESVIVGRLHAAEQRCAETEREFAREKQKWTEDKTKVLRYQKQLQGNYVQMYKRSYVLERQVQILTAQLQDIGVSAVVGIDPDTNQNELPDLCYPMDI